MSHQAEQLWVRNKVQTQLHNISCQLEYLNRLSGNKRMPAHLRKKLRSTLNRIEQTQVAFGAWAITDSEKAKGRRNHE